MFRCWTSPSKNCAPRSAIPPQSAAEQPRPILRRWRRPRRSPSPPGVRPAASKEVPGGRRRHASRSNPKARRREPEEFRPGIPEFGAKDSAEACASAEKVSEAAAAKRSAEPQANPQQESIMRNFIAVIFEDKSEAYERLHVALQRFSRSEVGRRDVAALTPAIASKRWCIGVRRALPSSQICSAAFTC